MNNPGDNWSEQYESVKEMLGNYAFSFQKNETGSQLVFNPEKIGISTEHLLNNPEGVVVNRKRGCCQLIGQTKSIVSLLQRVKNSS